MKRYIKSAREGYSKLFGFDNSDIKNLSYQELAEYFFESNSKGKRSYIGDYVEKSDVDSLIPNCAILVTDPYEQLSGGDLLLGYDRYFKRFLIFICDRRKPYERCEDSANYGYEIGSDRCHDCYVNRGNGMDFYYPVYLLK